MERTRYRIEIGRYGLEAITDPNGSWEYHADAQATVEALQAQLESANTLLHKKNCAIGKAETTIEALQRERDEAIRHKEIEKALTNEQAGLVGKLQAALNAEREKVKGLEKWRINVTAALLRPGGAFYEDVPKHVKEMAEQLSQLQALVRAYCEAKVAFDEGRLREDHHAWKERFSKLERTEAALIDYAMRTLDATTPAAKGGDGE